MLADVFIYKSFTCSGYSEFDADENLLLLFFIFFSLSADMPMFWSSKARFKMRLLKYSCFVNEKKYVYLDEYSNFQLFFEI